MVFDKLFCQWILLMLKNRGREKNAGHETENTYVVTREWQYVAVKVRHRNYSPPLKKKNCPILWQENLSCLFCFGTFTPTESKLREASAPLSFTSLRHLHCCLFAPTPTRLCTRAQSDLLLCTFCCQVCYKSQPAHERWRTLFPGPRPVQSVTLITNETLVSIHFLSSLLLHSVLWWGGGGERGDGALPRCLVAKAGLHPLQVTSKWPKR